MNDEHWRVRTVAIHLLSRRDVLPDEIRQRLLEVGGNDEKLLVRSEANLAVAQKCSGNATVIRVLTDRWQQSGEEERTLLADCLIAIGPNCLQAVAERARDHAALQLSALQIAHRIFQQSPPIVDANQRPETRDSFVTIARMALKEKNSIDDPQEQQKAWSLLFHTQSLRIDGLKHLLSSANPNFLELALRAIADKTSTINEQESAAMVDAVLEADFSAARTHGANQMFHLHFLQLEAIVSLDLRTDRTFSFVRAALNERNENRNELPTALAFRTMIYAARFQLTADEVNACARRLQYASDLSQCFKLAQNEPTLYPSTRDILLGRMTAILEKRSNETSGWAIHECNHARRCLAILEAISIIDLR